MAGKHHKAPCRTECVLSEVDRVQQHKMIHWVTHNLRVVDMSQKDHFATLNASDQLRAVVELCGGCHV